MEQHEVEEVSFLPGEAILNKKAVYEPSKGQRFRQVVCSRCVAICILLGMGVAMIAIALIAAFARPTSVNSNVCLANETISSNSASEKDSDSGSKTVPNFIATNGEDFPWKNLRLPKSIVPLSYDIFLHPDISQSFFKGTVRMKLKVVEKTDFIIFHTLQLNLSDVSVMHQSGSKIDIRKQLEFVQYQQYYIQVGEQLAPGKLVNVSVDFRGSLADLAKMSGLYKSGYHVNGEKRYMISTHFEPSDARSAFPCMDEPSLKAVFTMSIVRPSNLISLFNTKIARTQSYGDGLKLDVYKPTVLMSTYLVAYVVTDFKALTKETKDGVMVRVFAPEDKIYMGQYALDSAVTIIEKYNEFFGIKYPLEKQDLIAIPNFSAGAMENWGLITYRDTAVLYDPNKSTLFAKKRVAVVVAHELAHQWFGNLVTMAWWNDLWLNEGFASYVENIGVNTVEPNFYAFEGMVYGARPSLNLDSLASSQPVQIDVFDPAEVASAFNSITYHKGASLINMLKGAIGEEDFHKGLKYYLKEHAYGNAETKQLWEAFDKYTKVRPSVSDFMDTWTQQMGYPVVTVTRNGNKISLTQDRFLLIDKSGIKSESSPYHYTWHIPFKYILSDDATKSQIIWLKRDSATIQLPSSSIAWVKGNVNSEGFYRVNYDSQGWKAITLQLMNDHTVFSVQDRLSLIDDAFHLAQAGRISYPVVLDLCQYLVKETDVYVWSTFIKNMRTLQPRLYLHDAYDDLKAYMLHLARPLIDKVGWKDEGTYKERLMRRAVISLAIFYEYSPAVDKALEWFHKWSADESTKLNNDLASSIYNTGVKYGDKTDFDLVYKRFQTTIVPSNKNVLLHSLSASRDVRVLQILLERSLNSSQIKSQSTSAILAGVAGNPAGLLYTWRFLQMNWDTIFGRYGSGAFTLANILKYCVGNFDSQFDLDQVDAFFQGKEMGSGKNALEQAKEMISANIAWNKHYLKPVTAWLSKASSSNKSPR